MITKETSNKMGEKVKNINVINFDIQKINSDIDDFIKKEAKKAEKSSFAPKIKDNEFFVVKNKMGLIKGTNIVIDDECIGRDNIKHVVSVYSELRDENGKITSFNVIPRFTLTIGVKELIQDYTQNEQSLEEFMGDRFCRNDRICDNMNLIVKELKKI